MEATHKVIVDGLKKKLEEAKGRWVDELPHVLWTYHTTPRRSTREIPFSMTYGLEAIIPTKNGFSTIRSDQFLDIKIFSLDLDLVVERREVAMVRLAQYQQRL